MTDLRSLRDAIEATLATGNGPPPTTVIDGIRALAVSHGLDAGEAVIDTYPDLLRHRPALIEVYRDYILEQDTVEMDNLEALGSQVGVKFVDAVSPRTHMLYHRVREIVERLNLGSCKRAVMVGCGRLPFTLFCLADLAPQAEIIGLDFHEREVHLAEGIIRQFGYERLHAHHEDGKEFDYSDCEIIYVASMVVPKQAIVERVADTAPAHAQIVLWEPYSLGRLWAVRSEDDLDPRLEIVDRGSPSPHLTRDVRVAVKRQNHA